MRPRYLINLALVVIPALMLTWTLAAQAASRPTASTPVTASVTPLDVVLIIDATAAQAYDPPSMAAYYGRPDLGCGPQGFGVIGVDYVLNTMACVKACNDDPTKPCYPFKTVKDAAITFIDQLRPGYDRVAVISLERQPQIAQTLTLDLNAAKTAIEAMRVTDHFPGYGSAPGEPCPFLIGTPTSPYAPWKCTSSNLGRALLDAGAQFATPPFRDGSHRVVITLGVGAADATDGVVTADPDTEIFGFCPPKAPNGKNSLPFCHDKQWSTHNISTTAAYDAKDYAYDKTLYLGLAPDKSVPGHVPNGGLGITMFSIGLGKKVVCDGGDTGYDGTTTPVTCNPAPGNSFVDPDTGYPDGAESLLRYIGYIGGTHDPTQSDPCAGAGLGQQCGNYYFAPLGDGLASIYLQIANRLFEMIDFTAAPLAGPAPLTVNFVDQSVGDILTRTWDFGDTITSTNINPTHTYTLPGIYSVTLQISTALEVSVLICTNYITVYTPISADFSATPITGIHPLTVTFANQSTGDYDTALWNFGDDVTSTLINPTHTYGSVGVYTVTLQASGLGGTDEITRPNAIIVYRPVAAEFNATPLSGTAPLTVTFTNQATGDYTDALWNFGDDVTSTLINPTHIYPLTGTYTVTLQVSGPGGTAMRRRSDLIAVQPLEWKFYLPLLVR